MAQSCSFAQHNQREKVMKSRWQPRNGSDGRSGSSQLHSESTWIVVIKIFAINLYHHSHFLAFTTWSSCTGLQNWAVPFLQLAWLFFWVDITSFVISLFSVISGGENKDDLWAYFWIQTILDPSKATGIDGIRPKISKYCASALFKPLHYLHSLILRKHTIPLEWCIHCTVPVFKSGDKALVTNYRPISLLCNASKVLEQLIYNNIIDHINKIISSLQFGFLKHRSVVQQLLLLFDNMCAPTTKQMYYI